MQSETAYFLCWRSNLKNSCFGFHQVSKRSKTIKTTRPTASCFIKCFLAFGNLMKPSHSFSSIQNIVLHLCHIYHPWTFKFQQYADSLSHQPSHVFCSQSSVTQWQGTRTNDRKVKSSTPVNLSTIFACAGIKDFANKTVLQLLPWLKLGCLYVPFQ